jgi:hypothetical protein
MPLPPPPATALILAEITGRHRHTGLRHELFGGVLETHRADAGGFRPDPDQSGVDHRLREVGVLAKEAVPRVDRLRPRLLRCVDDLVAHEITLARRARPDVHRLVRHSDMQRLGVGVRIDRDRADPEPPRSADHAAGDLATIGDEERLHHPRMFPMFAVTTPISIGRHFRRLN